MKYNPNIVIAYFRTCGIPIPVTEYLFASHIQYIDKAGRMRSRGWKFDFAWPGFKVALEVEGGVWGGGRHTRGAGFVKDMQKYNTATVHGWAVLRTVPKELCMFETAFMIRRVLWNRKEMKLRALTQLPEECI